MNHLSFLQKRIFHTRIRSDAVTKKEQILGYFLGPMGVLFLICILNNYLNVYYTDVIGISNIWDGAFLAMFPVICKLMDAFTFIVMGRIVDRTDSSQGKARPWILLSAPIMLISMILLFFVPEGSDLSRALWIFVSYNLFYSIGYTAYGTAHTLLIPLATSKEKERASLSMATNALTIVTGTFVAILFPCILVPMMGTNRSRWLIVIAIITLICCPLMLFEYYYSVERITKKELILSPNKCKDSLLSQLRLCLKSRSWIIFMLYNMILVLFNNLSGFCIFYYCNWVLGSYNDGITQMLFYGVGNAPLGIGIFLCGPICKKIGRERAMTYGYVLAGIGCLFCLINPRSLAFVLVGQAIKATGLIPSTYMGTLLLADALDHVEKVNGKRCDGFSSSCYNIIGTVGSGIAMGIFNFFLVRLNYQPPGTGVILPVQNMGIQNLFIFCTLEGMCICYFICAWLLHLEKK